MGWLCWIRDNSGKGRRPFLLVSHQMRPLVFPSYEKAMADLFIRFAKTRHRFTLVAEPEGETPTLGRLTYHHDGIPYSIVQACGLTLGFIRPEDMVWIRVGCDADGSPLHANEAKVCRCGAVLPKLGKYEFTYSSGDKQRFLVAQCHRCGRCHWAEG